MSNGREMGYTLNFWHDSSHEFLLSHNRSSPTELKDQTEARISSVLEVTEVINTH